MDASGRDRALRHGRRRRSAASALVAMLVAFVLGALLNAPAMKKTALEMPFGGERSFRLALASPLATASHWLLLDRPARVAAVVFGKPDPGPAEQTVVVVPKPSSTRKPGARERPLPKPYKGHPLHLYIAGDSMMGLPGMALVNRSSKTRLIKPLLDYRISTGLCRPDFFNWPAQLRSQVKAFNAKAVAVMFGANDTQGVRTASGKVYQFESAGWKTEYRRRVSDAIEILFGYGVRRIYWIGQPVMPEATRDRHMRVLNGIYKAEAAKHPGVTYIDAHALLSNRDGGYSQFLPDADGEMQRVREADGMHLTYAGGLRIADAVMAVIEKEWLTGKAKPGAGGAKPGAGGASPKATASPAP